MDFKDILDIATLITSFAAASGLFFVTWQAREEEKSRQLQSTLIIFDSLGSDEQRKLRKFIYTKLPKDPTRFSATTLAKVEKVCDSFARAGLLFRKGLVDKDILLHYYGEATVNCWDTLLSYVEYARQNRGPYYLNEFQRLADAARSYRNSRSRKRLLL